MHKFPVPRSVKFQDYDNTDNGMKHGSYAVEPYTAPGEIIETGLPSEVLNRHFNDIKSMLPENEINQYHDISPKDSPSKFNEQHRDINSNPTNIVGSLPTSPVKTNNQYQDITPKTSPIRLNQHYDDGYPNPASADIVRPTSPDNSGQYITPQTSPIRNNQLNDIVSVTPSVESSPQGFNISPKWSPIREIQHYNAFSTGEPRSNVSNQYEDTKPNLTLEDILLNTSPSHVNDHHEDLSYTSPSKINRPYQEHKPPISPTSNEETFYDAKANLSPRKVNPNCPTTAVNRQISCAKFPTATSDTPSSFHDVRPRSRPSDAISQPLDVKLYKKSSQRSGKRHGHVTVHMEHDVRHETSSCQKCSDCCKKTFAFLVSHIGLCALVVGYSIAGGFIFKELEAPFEVIERSNVALKRKHHVEILWNMTENLNILFKDNWTAMAEGVLEAFQKDVYVATKENGWDGKDGDSNLQWSFTGALLYSVTVITTIGYGHIAPKTDNGRLVTIFYALIGIPLTLLCLANIGRTFSNCFKFTYKYTCRCLKWAFLPSRPVYKRRAERKRNSSSRKRAKRQLKNIEHSEELVFSIEDQKEAQEAEDEEVRVPVFISLGIMALYIFGGAVLFTLWEDDWDYLIGSYFCFITLSTIGFGDFVPGANLDSWANQEKTILCTLYLVFGLSLIAMCFNLMQEEVKLKFRWLAEKLNIIDRGKSKG